MALIRGGISAYLANAILNNLLNGVSYAFPATLYVGINTDRWTSLETATEPSATSTGYARIAITPAVGLFAVPSNGGSSNLSVLTFPTPLLDWCPLTTPARGLFVADAPTGGNILWGMDRSGGPKTILQGDVVSVAIGAATLQIT